MKQNILKTFAIVLVFCIAVNIPIYARYGVDFPSYGAEIDVITSGASKIWGTVIPIVQMLAFGAVIFAGLRYMFASADKKADIKRGLIILVIGSILVFATSAVVQFVVSAGNEIIN